MGVPRKSDEDRRLCLFCCLIDLRTLCQDLSVLTLVTRLWRHIANAAMAMLCVVPGGKVLRPLTGFCDVGKGLIRVAPYVTLVSDHLIFTFNPFRVADRIL